MFPNLEWILWSADWNKLWHHLHTSSHCFHIMPAKAIPFSYFFFFWCVSNVCDVKHKCVYVQNMHVRITFCQYLCGLSVTGGLRWLTSVPIKLIYISFSVWHIVVLHLLVGLLVLIRCKSYTRLEFSFRKHNFNKTLWFIWPEDKSNTGLMSTQWPW